MKKIFIFLLFSLSMLRADINFQGLCGSYDYNITVETNGYFDATCEQDLLLVYENRGNKNYIRGLKFNENMALFYKLNNGQIVSFREFKGTVEFVGGPTKQFLDGLAGILVAFAFFQIVMMIGG